jgi:hypothetical protein
VQFSVTVDHAELFSQQPALSADGALTFAPLPTANGQALLTITLEDSGGATSTTAATRTIDITQAAVVAGNYRALVHAPRGNIPVNGPVPPMGPTPNAQAGMVSLAVTPGGQFTGRLTLHDATVFPLRGKFDRHGTALFGPAAKSSLPLGRGARPLVLQLRWTAGDVTPALTGNLTRLDQVFAEISGDLAVFTAAAQPAAPFRNVPADLPGNYTIALSPVSPEPSPLAESVIKGHGYANLTVSRAGLVTLTGRLPDSTVVSYSGPILGDLSVPLYAPFSRGSGSLSGFAQFRDQPGVSDIDGPTLYWSRPATRTHVKLSAVQVALVGSKYDGTGFAGLKPASFTDYQAHAEFSGLHIFGVPLSADHSVQITGAVTAENTGSPLKLQIDARTGAISGRLGFPEARVGFGFRGVILSKQSSAYGYFPGLGTRGSIVIKPSP